MTPTAPGKHSLGKLDMQPCHVFNQITLPFPIPTCRTEGLCREVATRGTGWREEQLCPPGSQICWCCLKLLGSNSLKPKETNASNPKVHSHTTDSMKFLFFFLALLQFLSVPLPVHDSCPPQISAVQWKKVVSGLFKLAGVNKIKLHNFLTQLVRGNFLFTKFLLSVFEFSTKSH